MTGISPVGKLQIKLNIGADGGYFDLIENASYKRSSSEKGKVTSNQAHKDVDGWDYYGKTIVSDGKQYDVLINIRDTGEKQYVYDVTLRATKNRILKQQSLSPRMVKRILSQILYRKWKKKAIPDFNPKTKHGQRVKIRTTKKISDSSLKTLFH